MPTPSDPGDHRSPAARRYLLRCLHALEKGLPAPRPPAKLVDRLDEAGRSRLMRAVKRLADRVQAEPDAEPEPDPPFEEPPDGGLSSGTDDVPRIPGFSLVKRLGEGAFSVVYQATQTRVFHRTVAIKVARDAVGVGLIERRRERFFATDAEKLALLNDPNIVAYYDHGFIHSGPDRRRLYVVMQWVDGETLLDRINRTDGASLASVEHRRWAAGVIATTAGASHVAHLGRPELGVAGFQHGDIKSSNILIDAAGVPYLADFGLAQPLGATGVRAGTLAYMAPEILQRNAPAGPAADIYSLGATLHHALTGHPPEIDAGPHPTPASPEPDRGGPTPRLARIPSLPPDLDAIRLKCLDPDPSKRYPDAAALAADLRNYLAYRSVNARPLSPIGRLVKWARRRPVYASLSGVIAALVLVGLIGLIAAVKIEDNLRVQANVLRSRADEFGSIALDGLNQVGEFLGEGNSRLSLEIFPLDLRQTIVSRTITSYDRIARLQGNDAKTRSAKASALVGRARLRRLRGGTDDDRGALEDLTEAFRIYESLPHSTDAEVGLAQAAIGQVAILGPQRKFADALRLLDEALPRLMAVVAAEPTRHAARFLLARGLNNRATCYRGEGEDAYESQKPDLTAERLNRAEQDYLRAIEQMDILNGINPDDSRHAEWTSRILGNYGLLLIDLGQLRRPEGFAQAAETLGRAVTVAEALVKSHPDDMKVREAFLYAVINRADAWRGANRPAEAEAAYRQAAQAYDALHGRFPEMREFVWSQAFTRWRLGEAIANQGRVDAAIPVLNDARDRYQALVAKYPNVAEILAEQKQLLEFLGRIGAKPEG